MSALLAEVEVLLRDRAHLSSSDGCVLAVSGGRDSMLLLEVMARLQPRLQTHLVVAHFHHQLRGPDADADQRLVRTAAAAHGLRVEVGTASVKERRRSGESLETAARRLRHAFLARIARKNRCEFIATAHHADDQVELFLLRLLRGAGGVGLGGMEMVAPSPADPSVHLVRPFLNHDRDTLNAAAVEFGISWREDGSNQDLSIPRNRLRHELIPLIQRHYQSRLPSVVRRTQSLIGDQAVAIEALALQWLESTPRVPFSELAVAVQRDIIRIQGIQMGLPVSFDLVESLRLHSGTPHQISPQRSVLRTTEGRLALQSTRARLCFQQAAAIVELSAPNGHTTFGGVTLSWHFEPPSTSRWVGQRSGTQRGEERLDADVVGPLLHLRHWCPGDRFQPIGFPKPAKLQDQFTNAKVPAAARRRRILAASANGPILWVQGLRLGEPAKLTPATRRVLVLQWRPAQ